MILYACITHLKFCILMDCTEAHAAELADACVMLQVHKLPQVQPHKTAAIGCDHATSLLAFLSRRHVSGVESISHSIWTTDRNMRIYCVEDVEYIHLEDLRDCNQGRLH